MTPMITLPIAKIKTAPAARSLAFFASGFHSSVARSTLRSSAAFIASALHTVVIVRTRMHHSILLIFNKKPIIAAANVKKRWIRVFISLIHNSRRPLNAYLKELTRLLINLEIKIFSGASVKFNAALIQVHILIFPHFSFFFFVSVVISEKMKQSMDLQQGNFIL